ncbi:hypothetical protein B0J13DRAFT_646388 [Dactylonectria estremocensis]|uniref:Uncharacterized protein n=1 Tax=Dactylonectria estremocensis TaxID=1079267 RepID=A0A9P9IPA1_9HYPO|nr:hypothetical protein B0J13DRAFT_646388 [Dactylonectria estremocensis]
MEMGTTRTRQIREFEKVMSLWDMLTDDRTDHQSCHIKDGAVVFNQNFDMSAAPYMFYTKTNAVEDAVLFSDEFFVNKANVPFQKITNGVRRIDHSALPGIMHAANCDWMNKATTTRSTEGLEDWFEAVSQRPLVFEKIWLVGKASLAEMQTASRRAHELGEEQRACELKNSPHEVDIEPESSQRFLDIQDRTNTMPPNLSHSGPPD